MNGWTAKKIRDLDDFNGEAALFEMNPPLKGHRFVVASAIASAFDTGRPETFLFPANAEGKVTDWGVVLPGSQRGTTDHEVTLRDAGYEVEL